MKKAACLSVMLLAVMLLAACSSKEAPVLPTEAPTLPAATIAPTEIAEPTKAPTEAPQPTEEPTEVPTPTEGPSDAPEPTDTAKNTPTAVPTKAPVQFSYKRIVAPAKTPDAFDVYPCFFKTSRQGVYFNYETSFGDCLRMFRCGDCFIVAKRPDSYDGRSDDAFDLVAYDENSFKVIKSISFNSGYECLYSGAWSWVQQQIRFLSGGDTVILMSFTDIFEKPAECDFRVFDAHLNEIASFTVKDIEIWDQIYDEENSRILFMANDNEGYAVYECDPLTGNTSKISSLSIDAESYSFNLTGLTDKDKILLDTWIYLGEDEVNVYYDFANYQFDLTTMEMTVADLPDTIGEHVPDATVTDGITEPDGNRILISARLRDMLYVYDRESGSSVEIRMTDLDECNAANCIADWKNNRVITRVVNNYGYQDGYSSQTVFRCYSMNTGELLGDCMFGEISQICAGDGLLYLITDGTLYAWDYINVSTTKGYILSQFVETEQEGVFLNRNFTCGDAFGFMKFPGTVVTLEADHHGKDPSRDDFSFVAYDEEDFGEIMRVRFPTGYAGLVNNIGAFLSAGEHSFLYVRHDWDDRYRFFIFDSLLDEKGYYSFDGSPGIEWVGYDDSVYFSDFIFYRYTGEGTAAFYAYSDYYGRFEKYHEIELGEEEYSWPFGVLEGSRAIVYFAKCVKQEGIDAWYRIRTAMAETADCKLYSFDLPGQREELYDYPGSPVIAVTEPNGSRYIVSSFEGRVKKTDAPFGELYICTALYYSEDTKARITVPVSDPFEAETFVPDWKNNVLITCDKASTIRCYSLETGELLASCDMSCGLGDMGLNIDPANGLLYTSCGDGLYAWDYINAIK